MAYICKNMSSEGYGWEDCLVVLKSIGYATDRDAEFVRRFFLGVSKYTKRYGT